MLSRSRENAYLITDEKLVQSLSEKTGAKTSAIEAIKTNFKEDYIEERVKELLLDFKERHGIYLSNTDQYIKKAQYEANNINKYLKTHSIMDAKQLVKIESGIFFNEHKAPTEEPVIQKYNEYKTREDHLNKFYIDRKIPSNQAQIISKRIINYEIAFAKDIDHFKLKSIEKSLNIKDIEKSSASNDLPNKSLNTQNQIRDIGLEI